MAQCDWTTIVAVVLVLIFLSTYVITTVISAFALRSKKDGRDPPVVPYFIPFLGNSLSVAWDMPGFIATIT